MLMSAFLLVMTTVGAALNVRVCVSVCRVSRPIAVPAP
jgi:hypothetical protein